MIIVYTDKICFKYDIEKWKQRSFTSLMAVVLYCPDRLREPVRPSPQPDFYIKFVCELFI